MSSLRSWDRNARTHAKKQIRQIADSISRFESVFSELKNLIVWAKDNGGRQSGCIFHVLASCRVRRTGTVLGRRQSVRTGSGQDRTAGNNRCRSDSAVLIRLQHAPITMEREIALKAALHPTR